MEKKISILGSTGSIGTQTLDIVRQNPGIKVRGLCARSNVKLMEAQIREFQPELVCMTDETAAKQLKTAVADTDTRVIGSLEGLNEVASMKDCDTVVTAVVGIAGLAPTICAVKAGKDIALANKETLVAGGHIVTKLAAEYGVKLLPVDSEHSAIFQCLQGCTDKRQVKKIILTASGGPFFGKKRPELETITPQEALRHPNWDMGAKVTIDSSTLVNKGLEVIEAKWLFDMDIDDITVLVHRQSIVHSMVEYTDNGIIAQLGVPDMRLPIQYALTYPDRMPMRGNALRFSDYPALTFEKPDMETFSALSLAYQAGRAGGLLPVAFNSADEAAVQYFLEGKLPYLGIAEAIAYAMGQTVNIPFPTLGQIWETDQAAREAVLKFISLKD